MDKKKLMSQFFIFLDEKANKKMDLQFKMYIYPDNYKFITR